MSNHSNALLTNRYYQLLLSVILSIIATLLWAFHPYLFPAYGRAFFIAAAVCWTISAGVALRLLFGSRNESIPTLHPYNRFANSLRRAGRGKSVDEEINEALSKTPGPDDPQEYIN